MTSYGRELCWSYYWGKRWKTKMSFVILSEVNSWDWGQPFFLPQLILKLFIWLGKIQTEGSEIYIFPPTLTSVQSFCNMIHNGKMNIKSFRFQSVAYKAKSDGKQMLKLKTAIQTVTQTCKDLRCLAAFWTTKSTLLQLDTYRNWYLNLEVCTSNLMNLFFCLSWSLQVWAVQK